MKDAYVQYGCGWCAPEGWLNYDASPILRFERIPIIGKLYNKNQTRFPDQVLFGDIVRGLPLPDECCRGVYASHILEHLSLEDFESALRESFRLLRPSGIFRLVLPDLEHAARLYLTDLAQGIADANTHFMRRTGLGIESRPHGLLAFLKNWLGNSSHLWMWDYAGLKARLEAHGFVNVRRAYFNDCPDPAFSSVEEAVRFEEACAVEARKPTEHL